MGRAGPFVPSNAPSNAPSYASSNAPSNAPSEFHEQRVVEWLQTSTAAGWEDCTAAVDGAMVELCVDQTDFASLLIALHRGLAKRNVSAPGPAAHPITFIGLTFIDSP